MNRSHHIFILLLLVFMLKSCISENENSCIKSNCEANIYPDYKDITIPCNIAPLNFLVRDSVSEVRVTIKGHTDSLILRGSNKIIINPNSWKKLLSKEKRNTLAISVKGLKNSRWIEYNPFTWTISEDEIDPFMTYRLIEPGFEVWNKIKIQERNIENFDERTIADNDNLDGSCMNCHISRRNDPNLSLMHIRGSRGGTFLNKNGNLRKLNLKDPKSGRSCVYGDIHPSEEYAVFSTNHIIPTFHSVGSKRLEVYDSKSDIVVVDLKNNRFIYSPLFSDESSLETFPIFSNDGKYIYYCSARSVELPKNIKDLKYSLLRIGFDSANGTFNNKIDTIFNASTNQKSISFPRVSPDGKSILFTTSDYGTFPIWHREADLMMINLENGELESLDSVNSDRSDTYHSWSSSGRWFVFASKRDDGIYGKAYFCHINKEGKASKPFVLPQQDPEFYDNTLKSFNIPELIRNRLLFNQKSIEHSYFNTISESFN